MLLPQDPSGLKTQRYKSRALNQMKFAKPSSMLVFGHKDRVCGVAELAGRAARDIPTSNVADVLHFMHPDLHDPLRTYLDGYALFDYVEISRVFNLQPADITWKDLWSWDETTEPKNKQGLPAIGSTSLIRRLITLSGHYGPPITPYGDLIA